MRELKELVLPQLVEARKRNSGSTVDSPTMGHSLQCSPSSPMSDVPSPTFSLRGHSRMQSSASSLPSSPNMRDSSDTWGTGKRPLTEVKEEPQEKDDDSVMANGFTHYENIQGPSTQCVNATGHDAPPPS